MKSSFKFKRASSVEKKVGQQFPMSSDLRVPVGNDHMMTLHERRQPASSGASIPRLTEAGIVSRPARAFSLLLAYSPKLNLHRLSRSPVFDRLHLGRKVSSPHSGKMLKLTSTDVRLITDSWAKVETKEALVGGIFCKLFAMKTTQIAKHFLLNGVEGRQLEDHPTFKRHVDNFVNFIQRLVDTLGEEDEQKFVEAVRKVGLAHARVKGMSFTADKWLAYKRTILCSLCNTSDTNDSLYRAWNKLLMFVISEMKDSYLESIRSMAKLSNSCMELDKKMPTETSSSVGPIRRQLLLTTLSPNSVNSSPLDTLDSSPASWSSDSETEEDHFEAEQTMELGHNVHLFSI